MMTNRPLAAAARLTITLAAILVADTWLGGGGGASEAPRTGEFQLTFTMTEVVGAQSARAMADIIRPDKEITWDLYVPEVYRPQTPAGVLVYVSPSRSGRIPPAWKDVMERHNLIWIAASRSGNRVPSLRRATLALIATEIAKSHYEIAPERVYVSGFSGGGKVAGMLAAGYPALFRGAIYICGIGSLAKNPPRDAAQFRANRYVFLSGSRDTALTETRSVHGQYLDNGAEDSRLMIIRDLGHEIPDADDFEAAIGYLDWAE